MQRITNTFSSILLRLISLKQNSIGEQLLRLTDDYQPPCEEEKTEKAVIPAKDKAKERERDRERRGRDAV